MMHSRVLKVCIPQVGRSPFSPRDAVARQKRNSASTVLVGRAGAGGRCPTRAWGVVLGGWGRVCRPSERGWGWFVFGCLHEMIVMLCIDITRTQGGAR